MNTNKEKNVYSWCLMLLTVTNLIVCAAHTRNGIELEVSVELWKTVYSIPKYVKQIKYGRVISLLI
jgi:hypothetical protein